MRGATARDTWEAALGELQLQVTPSTFETWLKNTTGLALREDQLVVSVPTPFAAEWLERRMYQLIQKTVLRVAQAPLQVRFQVGAPLPGETRPNPADRGQASSPSAVKETVPLSSRRYTFDSFVVGPGNRLAYSAAYAVAEAPGHSYNPLFIYSGVGLGKTHLLHAVAQRCSSQNIDSLYVTTEQFTNEFITAIRERTTEEFRGKYRSVQVLLIDDIQFIGGREQTQEGFFHTFNDLHNASRQLVITSDRPPKALSLLEDRLRSRFEWGLIADIQPPSLEVRVAILRGKTQEMGVTVDDSVLEYVAKRVQTNVRELEGCLTRIVALAQFTNSPITLAMASRAMSDITPGFNQRSLDPERVLKAVEITFKVSREDLVGRRRPKDVAEARQVAMYLLREELGMPITQIARTLGGKNHSTVIYGLRKITYENQVNPRLRERILATRETLLSPPS